MIEIVFETHSTTEDNEAGRATGWLPGRLSPRGRAEAAELGPPPITYHGSILRHWHVRPINR
jgi:hypothetical protein